MAKFKAIPVAELSKVIPGWDKMALTSPLDMENLANMFEALDNYAGQNGLQFFQLHIRSIDHKPVAIFTLKE